jgi:hypothetical protein
MSKKHSLKVFSILVWLLIVIVAGCSGNNAKEAATQMGGQKDSAGGLSWSAPSSWSNGPDQQMRVRTYIVKPASGDADNAECAVFYFGNGQGGDKESNLMRWANQFEQPDGTVSADKAVINDMEISGLKVTTIQLDGTYKMSAGPMMEVKEKKDCYRLMGAIVEGSQGLVFFKFVGPVNTIKASETDFKALLNSVKGSGA